MYCQLVFAVGAEVIDNNSLRTIIGAYMRGRRLWM